MLLYISWCQSYPLTDMCPHRWWHASNIPQLNTRHGGMRTPNLKCGTQQQDKMLHPLRLQNPAQPNRIGTIALPAKR